MKKLFFAAIFATLVIASPAEASRSITTIVIEGDPQLMNLDTEIFILSKELVENSGDDQKSTIIDEQKKWNRTLPQCVGNALPVAVEEWTSAKKCLEIKLREHLQYLKSLRDVIQSSEKN